MTARSLLAATATLCLLALVAYTARIVAAATGP